TCYYCAPPHFTTDECRDQGPRNSCAHRRAAPMQVRVESFGAEVTLTSTLKQRAWTKGHQPRSIPRRSPPTLATRPPTVRLHSSHGLSMRKGQTEEAFALRPRRGSGAVGSEFS